MDEPFALRLSFVLPILIRHLERDFNGSGAVVGVEDFVEPRGREFHQLFSELNRGDVAIAEQRGVRDVVHLRLERGIKRGMIVPVDVRPH